MFSRRLITSTDGDKNVSINERPNDSSTSLMSRLKASKTEENKDIAGSDGNIRRERSENPLVFIDVVAGGRELGRINIELRADIAPIGR